ncbi:MAG TPA: PEP-CTERM sorting domain-containing protein [Verrucomicrobiae bacterium]|nr:PEP-CTERM sorting domain-containing protein [Verrucomicrobiae bacterium]
MKTKAFPIILASLFTATVAQSQMIISGYMANPSSTDSPYEYVQLLATKDIDFSATPMAVVFANNGNAGAGGWTAGGGLTYELSLTSGSVTSGQAFYVGGDGKTINGSGSLSLAGETWIRAVNTATTGGDLFGNSASAGVVGNGGNNADGIALFNTTNLTASTVPIDAAFYGSDIGSATNNGFSTFTLPANDQYNGGYLQAGDSLFPDPGGGDYTHLSGTNDAGSGSWTVARTGTLTGNPTSLSDITPGITVVPEPSAVALIGAGLVTLWNLRRRKP